MTKKNTETKQPENTPEVDKEILESAMHDLATIKQELADQVVELEELQSASLEESNAKAAELAELKNQLDALKLQLNQVQEEKNKFAHELKLIEDAKILNKRLSTLQELSLLRESEDGLKEQATKIIAMGAEEFDSYIAELSDIFSNIKKTYAEKIEVKQEPQIDSAVVAEKICKTESTVETASVDEEVTDLVTRAIKGLKSLKVETKVVKEVAQEGGVQAPAKESASINSDELAKGFMDIFKYSSNK